jgi:hypothetical protein
MSKRILHRGHGQPVQHPAQADGTVIDSGHPYKTRIVVRRPTAASRFNGTAVIEWNNVTAGHDLDIDWFQSHDYLMRNGYAWIGVTPQRIGRRRPEGLEREALRLARRDAWRNGGGRCALVTTSSRRPRRRFASRGRVNVMGG